jgi:hypothetical protein
MPDERPSVPDFATVDSDAYAVWAAAETAWVRGILRTRMKLCLERLGSLVSRPEFEDSVPAMMSVLSSDIDFELVPLPEGQEACERWHEFILFTLRSTPGAIGYCVFSEAWAVAPESPSAILARQALSRGGVRIEDMPDLEGLNRHEKIVATYCGAFGPLGASARILAGRAGIGPIEWSPGDSELTGRLVNIGGVHRIRLPTYEQARAMALSTPTDS